MRSLTNSAVRGCFADRLWSAFVEVAPVLVGDIVVEDPVGIEPLADRAAAAFEPLAVAGAVDEDVAHRLGGCGEEMHPVIPRPFRAVAHEPQVVLVNQRGRLQGLAGGFPGQAAHGDQTQLVVDLGEEFARGPGLVGLTAGIGDHIPWRASPSMAGLASVTITFIGSIGRLFCRPASISTLVLDRPIKIQIFGSLECFALGSGTVGVWRQVGAASGTAKFLGGSSFGLRSQPLETDPFSGSWISRQSPGHSQGLFGEDGRRSEARRR